MLESDQLLKKLELCEKVIEDLKLVDVVVVASIEDNGANSTCVVEPCALNMCTNEQHLHCLYFSNQIVLGLLFSVSLLTTMKVIYTRCEIMDIF